MQHTVEYTVTVHHEDGSYWAEVEELPGCFASGASIDELWEALQEAIEMYVSTPESRLQVKLKGVEKVDAAEVLETKFLVCS